MKRSFCSVLSLRDCFCKKPRKRTRLSVLKEENKKLKARNKNLSHRHRNSLLRADTVQNIIRAEAEKQLVIMKAESQREIMTTKLKLLAFVDAEKRAEVTEQLVKECEQPISWPLPTLWPIRNHKYPWLDKQNFIIPTCLIRMIARYLNDDDLFKLRFVNFLFYGEFYSQTVKRIPMSNPRLWKQSRRFNAVRAMKLALMGRKFRNVRSLVVPYSKRKTRVKPNKKLPGPKELSILTPLYFPQLEGIYLANLQLDTYIRHLPGHPKIEALYVPVYPPRDFLFLNEEKFPQLKVLEIISVSGVQATVKQHSNVEIVSFLDCDSVKWDDITRSNFPKLRAVYKMRKSGIPVGHKTRLESEGIECVEEEINTNVVQIQVAL